MIEGIVYELLAPLVDGRCYANDFLQEGDLPKWPAIRYTVVSQNPDEDICGTDTVDTDDVRVQLDIAAKTHGAVLSLRDEVIAAMMTHEPPPARQPGGFQRKDKETKVQVVTLEYVFQQSSES